MSNTLVLNLPYENQNYSKNSHQNLLRPKRSGTTWIVDDDGPADFSNIQDAVDFASNGDTVLVKSGTYVENILIDKSITVISDEGAEQTLVTEYDREKPIFNIKANDVLLEGFTVNFGELPPGYSREVHCIYLNNVSGCEIVKNSCESGDYFIFLNHSSHNIIRENKGFALTYLINLELRIVYLNHSHHNIVDENEGTGRYISMAIATYYSNNNTVRYNHFSDSGQIHITYSNNNTIFGNKLLRGTAYGGNFYIGYSYFNKIENNFCNTGYSNTLYLSGSSYNFVNNNTLSSGSTIGYTTIRISDQSTENLISNNMIEGPSYSLRITSSDSEFNMITNNSFLAEVEILANNNYLYSNNFYTISSEIRGNTLNFWYSPDTIKYYYRDVQYINYFGNYFVEYSGEDLNEDGLGDVLYNLPYMIGQADYVLLLPFQNYEYKKPEVDTEEASDITGLEVTLNGKITNVGGSIIHKRRFEWGITPNCGEYWTDATIVSLSNDREFYFRLGALQSNTTYYYRAWVKNSFGWNKGQVESFKTLRTPKQWIVDNDAPADFNNIQEAVDAAVPGDTVLVYPGVYTENIVINKPVNIKSISGYESTTIRAANPELAVFEIIANHIQISGFTMRDATNSTQNKAAAIYTPHNVNINHLSISNNYIVNNFIGIMLYYAEYCLIEYNDIISNSFYGIYSSYGTKLNEFKNNYMFDNGIGLSIYGGDTERNNVVGNRISTSQTGVVIWVSTGNTIKDNIIELNSDNGIYLNNRANYNNLINNTVLFNYYGIRLAGISNENTIVKNKVRENEYGVHMYAHGSAEYIENNLFRYNEIQNNSYGIYIGSERIKNNLFYLNNFENNYNYFNTHAKNYTNYFNSPSLPYRFYGTSFFGPLGNYYSDYNSTDNDVNGIGDNAYIFSVYEQDDFPLLAPFYEYFDPTQDVTAPSTELRIAPYRSVNFNTISFSWYGTDDNTPSKGLIYRYKLDPLETEWSDWTSETKVIYTDLPFNEYTFYIEAKDLAGNVETPPKMWTFIVCEEQMNLLSLISSLKSRFLILFDRMYEDFAQILFYVADVCKELEYNLKDKILGPLISLIDYVGILNPFEILNMPFDEPMLSQWLLEKLGRKFIGGAFSFINGWANYILEDLNLDNTIFLKGENEQIGGLVQVTKEDQLSVNEIKVELIKMYKEAIIGEVEATFNEIETAIMSQNGNFKETSELILDIFDQLDDIALGERNLLYLNGKVYHISNFQPELDTFFAIYNDFNLGTQISSSLSFAGTGIKVFSYIFTYFSILEKPIMSLSSITISWLNCLTKAYIYVKAETVFLSIFGLINDFIIMNKMIPIMINNLKEFVNHSLFDTPISYEGDITSIIFDTDEDNNINIDLAINNYGILPITATIIYRLRDLSESKVLVDLKSIRYDMVKREIKSVELQTDAYVGFFGGEFEALFELWLGPKLVSKKMVSFSYGWGRKLNDFLIEEGVIDGGDIYDIFYDSSWNTFSSIIELSHTGSKINLHVFDEAGHHLGLNYTTGEIENLINGSVYSGPLHRKEWIFLTPGRYHIQLVCTDASMEGVKFQLRELSFIATQGYLNTIPFQVLDYVESGEFMQIPLLLRELSHQYGIKNINITISPLSNSDGITFSMDPILNLFNLIPGESKLISLNASIPNNLPEGIYQGIITITAIESSNGTLIILIIPISLTNTPSTQEPPLIPTIDSFNMVWIVLVFTISLVALIIKKRKLIHEYL